MHSITASGCASWCAADLKASWVRQQAGAEGFAAFVPAPLPPDPPLKFTSDLQRLSEAAGRALGRLEGVSASLEPDRLLTCMSGRRQ